MAREHTRLSTKSEKKHLDILKNAVSEYKKKHPKAYPRNIAADLKTSEAQLLAMRLGADVWLLKNELQSILAKICRFKSRVMLLCRNEYAVSEISGQMKISTPLNDVINKKESLHSEIENHTQQQREQIKLSMNSQNGTIAYSILNKDVAMIFLHKDERRFSLQVFNRFGTALQKIFLDNQLHPQEFSDFFASKQEPYLVVPNKAPNKISPKNLERDDATELTPLAIRTMIENCAKKKVPLKITVKNSDCTQSYYGLIDRVMDARGWFNVLDPDFSLHLDERNLEKCYLNGAPADPVIVGLADSLPIIYLSAGKRNSEWTQILRNFADKPLHLQK